MCVLKITSPPILVVAQFNVAGLQFQISKLLSVLDLLFYSTQFCRKEERKMEEQRKLKKNGDGRSSVAKKLLHGRKFKFLFLHLHLFSHF